MSTVNLRRTPRSRNLSHKAKELEKIKAHISDSESDDEEPFATDSASDGSNYESSSSSDDSCDDDEEISSSSSSSEGEKKTYNVPLKSSKKKSAKEYLIKSEDYFSNTSKKSHSSNHAIEKLKLSKLSQENLGKMITQPSLSVQHESIVQDLCKGYEKNFDKWMCLLHEGFNIVTYGLGSKKEILNRFQKEFLSDLPVIVVNGFFPSLAVKDILDAILIQILELKETSGNIFETVDLIEEELNCNPKLHLYLIIHNLDGEMLRNSKSQGVIAKLAEIDNIHLIASIDHINAPLIWDQNKFNFTWWDITSFLPYREETSFETSMTVNNSGSLAISSLKNVFLSLTSNSKGIYLIIVKYQLENTDKYYQGMLFKDLYRACRDAYLVSSDLALRSQLTEFIDHKMVKLKRSADGSEHLIIPILNDVLKQFLDER